MPSPDCQAHLAFSQRWLPGKPGHWPQTREASMRIPVAHARKAQLERRCLNDNGEVRPGQRRSCRWGRAAEVLEATRYADQIDRLAAEFSWERPCAVPHDDL